jgi:hypothetical protein
VPAWPTFGFVLVSEPTDPTVDVRVEYPSGAPLTLFAALFHTAVVAHDAHAMELPGIAARTIRIDDLGVPPSLTSRRPRRRHSMRQAKPRPGTFWRPGISSSTKHDSARVPLRSGANGGWHGLRLTGLRVCAVCVAVDHWVQRSIQWYALGAGDI